jgi:hypothetical protein
MDVGSMILRMRRQIKEEIRTVEEMLSADKCASIEEYKKLVGIVAGLSRADSIIVDSASRMLETEENF